MSVQAIANVRALFSDLGIDFEKGGTDLVIDRFEQFSIDGSGGAVRATGQPCWAQLEVLDAA